VRQGFPRRKLEQLEVVDEVAKSSRDIFGFTARCDNDKLHGAERFVGAQFGQKCHNGSVCTGRRE
jgi:hypothetical protein